MTLEMQILILELSECDLKNLWALASPPVGMLEFEQTKRAGARF
jgi:hypothetical protein